MNGNINEVVAALLAIDYLPNCLLEPNHHLNINVTYQSHQ